MRFIVGHPANFGSRWMRLMMGRHTNFGSHLGIDVCCKKNWRKNPDLKQIYGGTPHQFRCSFGNRCLLQKNWRENPDLKDIYGGTPHQFRFPFGSLLRIAISPSAAFYCPIRRQACFLARASNFGFHWMRIMMGRLTNFGSHLGIDLCCKKNWRKNPDLKQIYGGTPHQFRFPFRNRCLVEKNWRENPDLDEIYGGTPHQFRFSLN